MGADAVFDLIVIAFIIFIITFILVLKFAPDIWKDRDISSFMKIYAGVCILILFTVAAPGVMLTIITGLGLLRITGGL